MTIDKAIAEGYGGQLGYLAQAHPQLFHAIAVHQTIRGQPQTIHDSRYLVEPLRDFPKLDGADIMKGVQTRWTETFVGLALRSAGWDGLQVAYVVPTAGIRNSFVQRRIDPLLQLVPAYRDKVPRRDPMESRGKQTDADRRAEKGAQNLSVKHFGRGSIMFLGSNKADHFVEWSADLAIVDELDHCHGPNLALLPDRLKASTRPQLFRLGNPTRPGVGIAKAYDQGDKRTWQVRCTHCPEWQELDWLANFVHRTDEGAYQPRDREGYEAALRRDTGADLRPVCRRCGRPFDRLGLGAWVPHHHPSTRDRRSYRLSRLPVGMESMVKLLAEWLEAQASIHLLQRFYRSNLGLAHESQGEAVTQELLDKAATGKAMDHGGPWYDRMATVAGVDVGAVLHVQVAVVERLDHQEDRQAAVRLALLGAGGEVPQVVRRARRRTCFIGTVPSFEALDKLLDRFRVNLAVVDAAPEMHEAQKLRDRRSGVYLCRYHPTERVGTEDYARTVDEETKVVTCDRTQLLDATLEDLQTGRHVLPCDTATVPWFSEQMLAPRRVLDDAGRRYIWDEGTQADHARHADAYCRVAFDLFQAGGELERT